MITGDILWFRGGWWCLLIHFILTKKIIRNRCRRSVSVAGRLSIVTNLTPDLTKSDILDLAYFDQHNAMETLYFAQCHMWGAVTILTPCLAQDETRGENFWPTVYSELEDTHNCSICGCVWGTKNRNGFNPRQDWHTWFLPELFCDDVTPMSVGNWRGGVTTSIIWQQASLVQQSARTRPLTINDQKNTLNTMKILPAKI